MYKLQKIFNKNFFVCVHPNYSLKESKKIYKKFKVVKYQTDNYVRKAFICVGFSSSVIVDAIFLSKKILILDSNLMGKHHQYTNNTYPNAINVLKCSIDDGLKIDKKTLLKELNDRIKNYGPYIKDKIIVDKNKIGIDKILFILKKNYNIF